jgi:hypothetical protein
VVAEVPLTPAKKVDRTALKKFAEESQQREPA